jgi:hypothetical protein
VQSQSCNPAAPAINAAAGIGSAKGHHCTGLILLNHALVSHSCFVTL